MPTIIQSPHDKCSYKAVTLENGLDTILISELGADKAAAALAVGVGNFQDPEEFPGLAHFLEHLLFMGTEKYPKEDDFSSFLSEHTGTYNAYTGEHVTNYFFEIDSNYLEPALDRFSQFFINPLFDSNCTSREILAVDSENKKNILNDYWRVRQLNKHLSDPQHPYSKFGTGNLETLGQTPVERGLDIRKILIHFHETYYSSNIMKLVVYGKESLETLEEIVKDKFSAIKNNFISNIQSVGKPFRSEDLSKLVLVKPVKDIKAINISFQCEDQENFFESKPLEYISHLIGHEGKGSILWLLKEKSLANSLSSGVTAKGKGYAIFNVQIGLTESGVSLYKEVVGIVFKYIELLKCDGVKEWIFNECKELSNIGFLFKEKNQAVDHCLTIAENMHFYPLQYILNCENSMLKYEEDILVENLKSFCMSNCRIMLISPESEVASVERWYGTKYSVLKIDSSHFEPVLMDESNRLHLPSPNRFIASDFLIHRQSKPSSVPFKVKTSDYLTLWHKLADEFDIPKASIFVLLTSEAYVESARSHVNVTILVELIKECLSDLIYSAELAGLYFNASVVEKGIEISIRGFNQKLLVFLEEIVDMISKMSFDQSLFDRVKENELRKLQNITYEAPFWHAKYWLQALIVDCSWSYEEKLTALLSLQFDDILEFQFNFLQQIKVEALAHGNINRNEVLSVEPILSKFKFSSSQVAFPRSLSLKRNSDFHRVCHDNINCGIALFYQICTFDDIKGRVNVFLFSQIFKEPFFETLRTQEQLGYIVSLSVFEKFSSIGILFLIQSEREPEYLKKRIDLFLAKCSSKLEEMSEDEFAVQKKSLILSLLQKRKKQHKEARFYWQEVLTGKYSFKRKEDEANAVKDLSLTEMKEFVRDFFGETANTPSLAIHINSSQPMTDFRTFKSTFA